MNQNRRRKKNKRVGFTSIPHQSNPYLWRNDVEEIACRGVFLGEDIVLIRLKSNAEHIDDVGERGQVQGDAVLPQEALQLGSFLSEEFQGHLRACI